MAAPTAGATIRIAPVWKGLGRRRQHRNGFPGFLRASGSFGTFGVALMAAGHERAGFAGRGTGVARTRWCGWFVRERCGHSPGILRASGSIGIFAGAPRRAVLALPRAGPVSPGRVGCAQPRRCRAGRLLEQQRPPRPGPSAATRSSRTTTIPLARRPCQETFRADRTLPSADSRLRDRASLRPPPRHERPGLMSMGMFLKCTGHPDDRPAMPV